MKRRPTPLLATLVVLGIALLWTGASYSDRPNQRGHSWRSPRHASASPHLPGGTLDLHGQLTDTSTGEVYGFELHAEEDPDTAGVGGMFFALGGPNLGMCDGHGPGAEPGTNPFAGFECGGSGNVSVRVDGCKASMETHGFVHSDHPNTVYFGSMTVDITYHRNAGDADGRLSVVVYTPKEPITLKGDVFADHLEMETCS